MKKLIIFICNGNIHRSVIAAECLRNIFKDHNIDSNFLIDSHGLQGINGTNLPEHKRLSDYPKEWKAAKPTLQRLGIDISNHVFQKISASIIKKASVIIVMDERAYSGIKNSLMKQFLNQADKIYNFSELTPFHKEIKDPAGSGDEILHRKIIESIYSTLNKKYKKILEWIK